MPTLAPTTLAAMSTSGWIISVIAIANVCVIALRLHRPGQRPVRDSSGSLPATRSDPASEPSESEPSSAPHAPP